MNNTITIHDLINHDDIITVSDDFVLIDNLDNLPWVNESLQANLLLFFFCIEGRMQMDFNEQTYHLSAGDVIACQPNKAIEQILRSGDCKVWIIGYNPRVVDHLLTLKHDVFTVLDRAFHDPVVHYGERYMRERLMVFLDMLRQRCLNNRLRFREQEVIHLFAAILFEVINHANERSEAALQEDNAKMSRADSIFKSFIQHLANDDGRHRTIAFYADILCVSPKHLSKIIKEKTGKKALDVINDHAIERIKLDLRLTDKPISYLADKYNFTNFSFFCQFVKQHLGTTPQLYRSDANC